MSDPYEQIVVEVVDHLRGHVLNQARYIYPSDEMSDADYDKRYFAADEADDEEMDALLKGTDLISYHVLAQLAVKIGLTDVFDEEAWVDPVADHIIIHKDDCRELWAYLDARAEK